MKKSFYLIFGMLLLSIGVFTSCDETEEVNRYADWRVRNERFLDSIAEVAKANATGEWRVIRAYSQDYENGSGSLLPSEGDVNDYIYVKVLQDAVAVATEELAQPEFENQTPVCRGVLFTDSVYVHYKGSLMNGDVFESSYTAPLDYEQASPVKFAVSGVVNGFTTALQKMRQGDNRLKNWLYKGDRWEVYIPCELAYGSTEQDEIPAYSVLVFDIALCRVWGVGETVPGWN